MTIIKASLSYLTVPHHAYDFDSQKANFKKGQNMISHPQTASLDTHLDLLLRTHLPALHILLSDHPPHHIHPTPEPPLQFMTHTTHNHAFRASPPQWVSIYRSPVRLTLQLAGALDETVDLEMVTGRHESRGREIWVRFRVAVKQRRLWLRLEEVLVDACVVRRFWTVQTRLRILGANGGSGLWDGVGGVLRLVVVWLLLWWCVSGGWGNSIGVSHIKHEFVEDRGLQKRRSRVTESPHISSVILSDLNERGRNLCTSSGVNVDTRGRSVTPVGYRLGPLKSILRSKSANSYLNDFRSVGAKGILHITKNGIKKMEFSNPPSQPSVKKSVKWSSVFQVHLISPTRKEQENSTSEDEVSEDVARRLQFYG
ncbi:hypothetical protein HK096_002299, partial [Nowakowskiella sp. JEL0078]